MDKKPPGRISSTSSEIRSRRLPFQQADNNCVTLHRQTGGDGSAFSIVITSVRRFCSAADNLTSQSVYAAKGCLANKGGHSFSVPFPYIRSFPARYPLVIRSMISDKYLIAISTGTHLSKKRSKTPPQNLHRKVRRRHTPNELCHPRPPHNSSHGKAIAPKQICPTLKVAKR